MSTLFLRIVFYRNFIKVNKTRMSAATTINDCWLQVLANK